MRTTLNLDDDVLEDVKLYADSRSVPIGKAASELLRRGLQAPVATRVVNGIHVVVIPSDSPRVDSRHVKRIIEDEL